MTKACVLWFRAAWPGVLVTVICSILVVLYGGDVTDWTFTHVF